MSTNTTLINHWIKRLPFAVILLALVFTLIFAFLTLQPAVSFGSAVAPNDPSVRLGIEADAARYTAMAEFYPAWRNDLKQVHKVNAARYTAMTEFYSAWRDSLHRVHEVDAARYTAMAEYYAGK
ncbi:MAG: hypothetical protein C3F07_15490 [Anaerolineales bacterium]|nr:hypothetical protein [Anaerolineae bacterium]PWB71020.1 MAG: hypothetical protein C3F07_15490 [Anaerolineales bacterium]